MNRISTRDLLIALTLVAVAVSSRLLPHEPNFTALMAVGLLAATVLRSRILAAVVPMAAMVLSDAVIGGYNAGIMLAVYGAMLLPLALSPLLRGRLLIARAATASVVCSVLFFTISNGAVWAFGSMYDASASGLAACFGAAIPFFKYQLAGDLVYTLTLFAVAAALPRLVGTPTVAAQAVPARITIR